MEIDRDEEETCARCGMEKDDWTGNNGKGIRQEGEAYCCKGCADDTGCTCD